MASETASFNEEVLAALAPSAGERILEVGFGHGRTLATAAERATGAWIAGVDASADAVRVAEGFCRALIERGQVELRLGESTALPWPDATFDKVFSVHTLYFWSDPEKDLRGLARVLRPGGLLIIGFREKSEAAVASFPPPVYRFRSESEVVALVYSAGFVSADVKRLESSDLRILSARSSRE
jgi:ubiquinone/menaquinone biosynthesis C-methylase UbiE